MHCYVPIIKASMVILVLIAPFESMTSEPRVNVHYVCGKRYKRIVDGICVSKRLMKKEFPVCPLTIIRF